MTRSLDRLIEEKLRALIIARVSEYIQVVTSLMGGSEALARLPRIVIKCESQDTPELFEAGVFRIATEISSLAEATSPISSDELEEMNTGVDNVVIWADNIPASLSSSQVLTYGVVHGGESQSTDVNRIIRTRRVEIWSKLKNAPPFIDT